MKPAETSGGSLLMDACGESGPVPRSAVGMASLSFGAAIEGAVAAEAVERS